MRLKEWRNGKGGKWTRRIVWYDGAKEGIRLRVTLAMRENYQFHKTAEYDLKSLSPKAAEAAWEAFKAGEDLRPADYGDEFNA